MARARASFCLAASSWTTISRCRCAASATWARSTSMPGARPACLRSEAMSKSACAVASWAWAAAMRLCPATRLQVESGAGQHHRVARALCCCSDAAFAVETLGLRVAQRVQVEDGLRDVAARVDDVEGADELREIAEAREPEGGQADLLALREGPRAQVRQEVGARLGVLALRLA